MVLLHFLFLCCMHFFFFFFLHLRTMADVLLKDKKNAMFRDAYVDA